MSRLSSQITQGWFTTSLNPVLSHANVFYPGYMAVRWVRYYRPQGSCASVSLHFSFVDFNLRAHRSAKVLIHVPIGMPWEDAAPSNTLHMCTARLALKEMLFNHLGSGRHVHIGRAGPIAAWRLYQLMSPNKDETDVHGCHWPGDMQ